MATLADLEQQLAQKDATINSLKEKTKDFVSKLKIEHAEAINKEIALKQQNQVGLKLFFTNAPQCATCCS